ncbi:MAG TPA: hypothetical protein VNM92_12190 [Thermoanaerobaculia bacterium]|nr:hypothetical protein [Thermoanaerobaculia bacterium]
MNAKMVGTAAALALLLASAPVAMAKKNDARKQAKKEAKAAEKFDKHDRNNDGSVNRDEWKGNDRNFDRLDTNRDGRVSQTEARNGRDTMKGRNNSRFRGMDANNDGRITRAEWRGNDNSFRVHDRNGDGVLSGNETRSGKGRDRD